MIRAEFCLYSVCCCCTHRPKIVTAQPPLSQIVEGLFGFRPDHPNSRVVIAPQWPSEWGIGQQQQQPAAAVGPRPSGGGGGSNSFTGQASIATKDVAIRARTTTVTTATATATATRVQNGTARSVGATIITVTTEVSLLTLPPDSYNRGGSGSGSGEILLTLRVPLCARRVLGITLDGNPLTQLQYHPPAGQTPLPAQQNADDGSTATAITSTSTSTSSTIVSNSSSASPAPPTPPPTAAVSWDVRAGFGCSEIEVNVSASRRSAVPTVAAGPAVPTVALAV